MDYGKGFYCRICGYFDKEEPPWGEDGETPNHEMCVCCGIEFGLEDIGGLEHIISIREHWLTKMKGKWQSSFFGPPEDWDLEQQLKQIPKEFQGPDDLKIYAQLKAKKSR
ncbi:MAG: hypothetical protein DHS20C07_00130 [Methyloligella sp.]|nr:MAG: hypothetical protein DHS20C07_00130 [Methyloligella sp.]